MFVPESKLVITSSASDAHHACICAFEEHFSSAFRHTKIRCWEVHNPQKCSNWSSDRARVGVKGSPNQRPTGCHIRKLTRRTKWQMTTVHSRT